MPKDLTFHEPGVTKKQRAGKFNHKPCCLWFTGLSGSGKSTIAMKLEKELFENGINSFVLDGDNVRRGLNKDLDFSESGRSENIRRIGEVAKLFTEAGFIIITSFISPFEKDRNNVRKLFPDEEFLEVFIDCDIETCIQRDSKGLYKKALNKEIDDFTGISSPYETPKNPDIKLTNNNDCDINKNVSEIFRLLKEKNIIPA